MKILGKSMMEVISALVKPSLLNYKSYLLVAGFIGFPPTIWAGAYIFADETRGADFILHPTGYDLSGTTGGTLSLNICIAPGTPNEIQMEQSVRNIIAVYNQLLPTTGNVRTNFLAPGIIDFESVALHELGHCLGKAHVNAASESGLGNPDINSTKALVGVDTILNINAGVDGVIGSNDDVRGDDVNLHWYRTANNNPFTIDYSTVDFTTYAQDVASLPAGHLFAANADRTVGANLLNTPATEAVMQQGTFFREIQRTVTPDGVATLQYAMSGIDEAQGTADDYDIQLNFVDPQTSSCDIDIFFDIAAGDGLAFCQVSAFIGTGHGSIASAEMHFNDVDFNWSFNGSAPCTETLNLSQNQWRMFTLPCSVGISTGNTVADVLGDDLTGTYDTNWVVYERDAANDVYTQLVLADAMFTGKGYWVFTTEAGQSFDVEGQFNGSPDTLLSGDVSGRQNLVGHPFDFSVDWADVQIVDGSEVQTLAAAVVDGDLSATYHSWNGNSYDAFDDSTMGMIGTLTQFNGIWVNAFKDGIRLRVPALVSSVMAGAIANTQLAAASEQIIDLNAQDEDAEEDEGNKVSSDGAWFVRVIVESGDYQDSGNVLGQLPDSLDGQDRHDLEELEPFGDSYLTVIFPHDDWQGEGGKKAWGYTSDFHKTSRKPRGQWTFAVHASQDISQARLRLEGPKKILRKTRLVDMETGKKVRFTKGAYTFELTSPVRYFSLRVGKKAQNK